MTNSLADLCRRADASARFAIIPDRRQIADRRRSQRGGRRQADIEPTDSAFDPLWDHCSPVSHESETGDAADRLMNPPLTHA